MYDNKELIRELMSVKAAVAETKTGVQLVEAKMNDVLAFIKRAGQRLETLEKQPANRAALICKEVIKLTLAAISGAVMMFLS